MRRQNFLCTRADCLGGLFTKVAFDTGYLSINEERSELKQCY